MDENSELLTPEDNPATLKNELIYSKYPEKGELTSDGSQLDRRETYFLSVLFGEAAGDVTKARKLAGYGNPSGQVPKHLRDEIIKRAESLLALNAPKAAMALTDGLDGKSGSNAEKFKVDVAEKILDRVGISKKQQVELNGEVKHSIFILPAKQPVIIDGVAEILSS